MTLDFKFMMMAWRRKHSIQLLIKTALNMISVHVPLKMLGTNSCVRKLTSPSVSVLPPATTLWSASSSSSCAGWRLSRACHWGWHRLLTLHCGSLLWRCVDRIFRILLVLSLPHRQLYTVDLNLKLPITAFSPHGCVLICHIMSHLQHCISNIPSITGRLRGEFKIALLQAIWVCGAQMCSLSSSVLTHT